MSSYDVGDSVTLTTAFTNHAGAATDPTAIAATVRAPSGAETDYAIGDFTHVGDGRYELIVLVGEAGDWEWRIAGSGAVTAAGEGCFYVRESAF